MGTQKNHGSLEHPKQMLRLIDKKICTVLLSTIVFTRLYVSMFLCLYFQVFAPTDYNNPLSIKNHNEVLRCFAVLGKYSWYTVLMMNNYTEEKKV